MITMPRDRRRGSTLIEFVFIALTLFMLTFAIIEFARLAHVYTAIAHAAKAGTRYAIVHGSYRTGASGSDPQSGPGNTTNVETVVRTFASAGILNTASLPAACGSPTPPGICVTYPDGGNETGDRVSVTVTYPYDPFVGLPLSINIRARSQGIIVF